MSLLYIHTVLTWLYSKGYTTKTALSTMTLAPLTVILFINPLLLNLGDWLGDQIDTNLYFKDDTDLEGPGIHEIEGHYRTLPNGEVTYVDLHIRTNPNGIEIDNLSYRK